MHLFAPWDASGATKKNSIRSYFLVHLTRLELAHPKALPPQGSVYTNFTTGACLNYITKTEKINHKIVKIARIRGIEYCNNKLCKT